ncbi:DNA polymerase epsilon, subunit B [Backusella circina FSU 941]|nr:DNA polymerase epsilon, subunit B [Backusella circina FSU 941]
MLQTSASISATPFQRVEDEEINDSLQEMSLSEDPIDIQQHFHVIDAFDLPQYKYDEHRKNFYLSKEKPSLLAPPKKKGEMFRERYLLIKQRLLRNEMFTSSSLGDSASSDSLSIKPIRALIGHDGGSFILFGMLTQLEEGKFFLEDEDSHIQLNLNEATFDNGLFTDGSLVLVDGVYGDDHLFHVQTISLPPPEPRSMTDSIFSHIDFSGLPKPLIDEQQLKAAEESHKDITFITLSDVYLDKPEVMRALREIFAGYSQAQIPPLAFILMGNFQSTPFNFSDLTQYKDNFSALADLISEYRELAQHSNFVFVPGSNDPTTMGNTLPRGPIMGPVVERVKQKVKHCYFTTNPCRIRYCTQDIVIYREDLLGRLLRNAILPLNEEGIQRPTKELVRTIMDQGHLSPFSLNVSPTDWAFDHALQLYPLPHAVILADKCEEYNFNYEGTNCVNPSSFLNTSFTWSLYYPALRQSEKW